MLVFHSRQSHSYRILLFHVTYNIGHALDVID